MRMPSACALRNVELPGSPQTSRSVVLDTDPDALPPFASMSSWATRAGQATQRGPLQAAGDDDIQQLALPRQLRGLRPRGRGSLRGARVHPGGAEPGDDRTFRRTCSWMTSAFFFGLIPWSLVMRSVWRNLAVRWPRARSSCSESTEAVRRSKTALSFYPRAKTNVPVQPSLLMRSSRIVPQLTRRRLEMPQTRAAPNARRGIH